MIEEDIPQILREVRVNACKDRMKVGLKHLDGTFSSITAMDIRRDKLELDVPLLFGDTPAFGTGSVVKDLQFDNVVAVFEAFYDGGVGINALGVLLGIELRLGGCIGVALVGNQNVLISAARANGEAVGVIYIKFTNWFYVHM